MKNTFFFIDGLKHMIYSWHEVSYLYLKFYYQEKKNTSLIEIPYQKKFCVCGKREKARERVFLMICHANIIQFLLKIPYKLCK